MKRILKYFLILATLFCIQPLPVVLAGEYTDVSSNHWASGNIERVSAIGVMNGMGDNTFGVGRQVKRSEFVSMLVRLFEWDAVTDIPKDRITDNTQIDSWYYIPALTAAKHGIFEEGEQLRPEDPITREEMAVMLIRALGYDELARSCDDLDNPFTDVRMNKGYITMAYDFGIVSGKEHDKFDPNGTAMREEAAAMMVRTYDKYHGKLGYIHGFYAFSSWDQKEMAAEMDGLSYGWSRLEISEDGIVTLNTTSNNNNEWKVPLGYEQALDYFEQNNIPTNLNIYMSAMQPSTASDGSASNVCRQILLYPERRKAAIEQIITELTVNYKMTGKNPYAGVTIDFENMKGQDLKEGFNQFLMELNIELDKINKTLFVAVHPTMKNSTYFDAYDYYTIGQLADKVILMAHDYQAKSVTEAERNSGFTITPLTPIDQVYYGLQAITDGNTGVKDKSKIVLAVSISSVGWSKKDGIIINSSALTPSMRDIYNHLQNGANRSYSEEYRNPYIKYMDAGTGAENVIWYEDAQSITDKIQLARMFGIDGLSIWRIGIIPNYEASSGLNVWDSIQKQN